MEYNQSLLELARNVGLKPKLASTSGLHGKEYHCECPSCGGTDRFILQPDRIMKKSIGRYKCRVCEIWGDSSQFGKTFVGIEHTFLNKPDNPHYKPISKILDKPSVEWRHKLGGVLKLAADRIHKHPKIIKYLSKRGINTSLIKKFNLGYIDNPNSKYGDQRIALRGTSEKKMTSGEVWLPRGIAIPIYSTADGLLVSLKVRKDDWSAGDCMGKYFVISGSVGGGVVVGNTSLSVMVVVESELDAYALYGVVSDVAFIFVTGSSANTKGLHGEYARLASCCTTLLICHDNDSAGLRMFERWKSIHKHAVACPVPIGKDIGEAIQSGLKIREWFTSLSLFRYG